MSDERIPIDELLDLAEGNLPEDEAARLEATLDDSDRRELAVQAAVRSVLGQLPDPELSDTERTRLRAAVRAELRVQEASPEPSGGLQERRSWLARVIPSAAAAASVVAMIAVAINLVDTGPGQEAADFVPVTAAPATTAAAAATTAAAAEAPEDSTGPAGEAAAAQAAAPAMDAADIVEEAEAARAVAEEAVAEAEMAMEEALVETPEAEIAADVAMADEEASALGPGYVAFEVETGQPEEAREMLGVLETLAAVTEMPPVPVAELADRAGEQGLVCWQAAADLARPSGVITWMAPGLVDGVAGEAYLVAAGSDEQAEAGVLALFVYPDCQAVALRAVTDRR
jgi:chemotaxis protein histidine kinase CheA